MARLVVRGDELSSWLEIYESGVQRVLECLGYAMVLLVYWMSNRGFMYSCRSFLLLVSMTWVIAFVHDYCSIVQTVLPTPVNVHVVLVFPRRVLHPERSFKLRTAAF